MVFPLRPPFFRPPGRKPFQNPPGDHRNNPERPPDSGGNIVSVFMLGQDCGPAAWYYRVAHLLMNYGRLDAFARGQIMGLRQAGEERGVIQKLVEKRGGSHPRLRAVDATLRKNTIARSGEGKVPGLEAVHERPRQETHDISHDVWHGVWHG